jgi:hypothetical protein
MRLASAAFRRTLVVLAALAVIGLVTLYRSHLFSQIIVASPKQAVNVDKATLARIEKLTQYCRQDDEFENEYGRTNLRLSRAYEGECFGAQRIAHTETGSHHAVRQFLFKALTGERLVVSAIGGSGEFFYVRCVFAYPC